MSNGWIGVDLDGTLAVYDGWKGPQHIGEPVPAMVERVKAWLAEDREVRILTARVARVNPMADTSRRLIGDWCEKHLGQRIHVTAEKDFSMTELWDDRAVQVIPNTGAAVRDLARELVETLDDLVMACKLPGDHCEVEQAVARAEALLEKHLFD